MAAFLNNSTILISAILFFGMIGMDYLGFKIRFNRHKKNGLENNNGLGSLEGALLGLLALLLAFTFNLSASRYDARRQTIVDEANNIGTALLRTELYPDSIKNIFNADFKQYIEERINYYEVGDDETKIQDSRNQSAITSGRIWSRVASLSQKPENVLRSMQMIPATNSMIDSTASRDDKRLSHIPYSILYLLFTLCLASAFIIGYGRKDKKVDLVLVCCFTLMITITVYLILDLDQSRSGTINMDTSHLKMIELRKLIK